MVRKIVRILSLVWVVLVVGIPARGEGIDQFVQEFPEWTQQTAIEEIKQIPYFWALPEISDAEPPKTGDYPAPIFTAMLLSLGIVILMVVTENRRK